MFDDVLIPLDGSENSEAIFPVLQRIVGTPARVELLHAVAIDAVTVVDLPGLGGVSFAGMLDSMLDAGRGYLEKQAAPLREAGAEVTTTVVSDGPEQAIFAAAARHPLIAMASHGRSGPQRWLIGSVTERILRGAPCPVLVVNPSDDGSDDVSTLMVAVDGSHKVEAVLPLAAAMARKHEAKVALVAVVEAGDANWAARAEQYLADADAALGEDIECVTTVRKGPTSAELIAHASESGAGLILMATHGRGGLERMILGSVTEEVLRGTGVPMLVTSVQE